MLRNTLILLILTIHINFIFSQSTFDNDLLLLENKIFNSPYDTIATIYSIEKLDLYIKNKDYGIEALQQVKRIDHEKIQDSTARANYLWNATLMAHFNDDKIYASNYLSNYFTFSKDTGIKANLLSILINNRYDTSSISKSIEQLTRYNHHFDSLTCINKIYAYELKHKKRYTIASWIVPGLGNILNGEVLDRKSVV